MPEIENLKNKIKELENKIKILEAELKSSVDPEEKELMSALYQKAKQLVKNQDNPSIIFLQKKLIIDFPRARKILNQLRKDGIVK